MTTLLERAKKLLFQSIADFQNDTSRRHARETLATAHRAVDAYNQSIVKRMNRKRNHGTVSTVMPSELEEQVANAQRAIRAADRVAFARLVDQNRDSLAGLASAAEAAWQGFIAAMNELQAYERMIMDHAPASAMPLVRRAIDVQAQEIALQDWRVAGQPKLAPIDDDE